jgi:DNA-binding GntR family transcriptional regulator
MIVDGNHKLQKDKIVKRQLMSLDQLSGSLSAKVYLVLKDAILSLAFRPGENMRKGEICDALGVSRSPVSEAIAKLASEGLVDVVPQAGTFVSRFSMEEIREGAFLREALELATVELVASTVTEQQLVLLRRNLRVQQALVDDGDIAGFYQLDMEMHALIQSFTGYKRLARFAESSWIQVDRARQLNLPSAGRMQETVEEHRRIVEAIEARDPKLARRAMRDHLRQLIKYLEPLERQRPELFKAS